MTDILMVDLTPIEFPSPFISGYIILTDYHNFINIEQGPASKAGALIKKIRENGFTEESKLYLFVTHIHLDHAGSLGHLLNEFEDAVAYIHPRGIKHMVNPDKLWNATKKALGPVADIYGEPLPSPAGKVAYLEDGASIEIDGEVFRIVYTEGHASHHQSVYWVNEKAMFVGDSAGLHIMEYDYSIPTSVYPFNYKKYLEGLDKMISYGPEVLMYPHYGVDEGGVDSLRRHKEIVSEWFEIVQNNLDKGISEIINEIRKKDSVFNKVYEELKDNPVISQLIKISIRGMLAEAERLKQEGEI